ncbi:hypothetical protein EHS25_005331 [Saitozyma podzolica]|uniref:YCII-related domain-containing protein n=1 Tax=Saitozyma podzolica TaxID=1890683 RepID=A0A427XYY8_9TREE|nr:hypothetical protein EHS25_005331 [Saitozyma podzolica]
MPLYFIYGPDYPGAVQKRLAARPAHLAMGAESGKKGEKVFGRGFLSQEYSHTEAAPPPSFPSDQANPGMAGSGMIYRFKTLDDAWKRIKADPYWTEGVWDKEKMTIVELMEGPNDETMQVV